MNSFQMKLIYNCISSQKWTLYIGRYRYKFKPCIYSGDKTLFTSNTSLYFSFDKLQKNILWWENRVLSLCKLGSLSVVIQLITAVINFLWKSLIKHSWVIEQSHLFSGHGTGIFLVICWTANITNLTNKPEAWWVRRFTPISRPESFSTLLFYTNYDCCSCILERI